MSSRGLTFVCACGRKHVLEMQKGKLEHTVEDPPKAKADSEADGDFFDWLERQGDDTEGEDK